MKRLIKGLLAMTTLLLGSCGSNNVVISKIANCSAWEADQHDPRITRCDLYNNITMEKWTWEGHIDQFVPTTLYKYHTGLWFEYSDGTHILYYGMD